MRVGLWLVQLPLSAFLVWSTVACLNAQSGAQNLYRVRLPVEDQTVATRETALAQGLHAVLVQVTGQLSFDHPLIRQAMREAAAYLTEYSYSLVVPEDVGEGQYWLELKFADTLVDQLITEAALPVWSSTRPSTLVWLIVEQKKVRSRVGAGSVHPVAVALNRRAEQRGVPLVFPSMDFKDAVALSDQDLWNFAGDAIHRASARYGVMQILVGKMQEDTLGRWHSKWQLLVGDEVISLQHQSAQAIPLGARIVDEVAQRLVARYAVQPSAGDEQSWALELTNLQTPSLIAAAEAYLRDFAAVKTVQIRELQGAHLVFDLSLNADMAQFMSLLEASAHMQAELGLSNFRDVQGCYRFTP